MCKAKLGLSHRCQPLTHNRNTVPGAGVAGQGGGQACQATQALWGNNLLCKGLTNRPPQNWNLEKLKRMIFSPRALALVFNGTVTQQINALAVGTAWRQ